ncbi:MAG: SBBP repeat-containing protein, partial [Candidatus Kariarchaeaceae archaeon]
MLIFRIKLNTIVLILVLCLTASSGLNLLKVNNDGVKTQISKNSTSFLNNPDFVPQTKEEVEQLFDGLANGYAKAPNKENIKIPFSGFLKNSGQNPNENIKYYYSTKDSYIGFASSRIYFSQSTFEDDENGESIAFDLTFPGSSFVIPQGLHQLNHQTNYFIGEKRLTNIESNQEIWYYNLYPNIDLRYYMSGQGLKYDFIVHPGGNPGEINVQTSGSVHLEVHSSKVAIYSAADVDNLIVVDDRLEVYQEDGTKIDSRFEQQGENSYGLEIDKYDVAHDLIIDPVWLGFSTYLGGSSDDDGYSIAVDIAGNAYIAGYTTSIDFPTQNPYQTDQGFDVFVTKLDATSNGLVYSTYLGGSSSDFGYCIAVNNVGNAFITGYTDSTDFPTLNPYQTDQGSADVFVTKLNATGNGLEYSTYLGGGSSDQGWSIAVNIAGNAYITGLTSSTDFPTLNPYQTDQGGYDVFVSKLNTTGNGLEYSTYLGGGSNDDGYHIAIDIAGNAYITGLTSSTDFPTLNPYQTD